VALPATFLRAVTPHFCSALAARYDLDLSQEQSFNFVSCSSKPDLFPISSLDFVFFCEIFAWMLLDQEADCEIKKWNTDDYRLRRRGNSATMLTRK
jgi:hypothetical protein